MGTVTLDPSMSPTLAERRGDVAGSLTFRLAQADVAAGPLMLRVGRITDAIIGRRLVLVEAPGTQATITVGFVESPPLRVRVIGMRYIGRDGQSRSPRALDFALLLSWLGRAFPVASVESTQIVTDIHHPPPLHCGQVNALLAGTRNLDIAMGIDPKTHYLGLVSDAEAIEFMQGCSSGIPATPDPTTVASAPAGVPRDGFSWDADGSYADWYGRTSSPTRSAACTPASDQAKPGTTPTTRSPTARSPTGTPTSDSMWTTPRSACRGGPCQASAGTT
jgi:hypothetical protein